VGSPTTSPGTAAGSLPLDELAAEANLALAIESARSAGWRQAG
jgi:hypothetical protein